jgi:hypothetical protein
MSNQTREFGIFKLQRGEMHAACMLDPDLCYDKLDAGTGKPVDMHDDGGKTS